MNGVSPPGTGYDYLGVEGKAFVNLLTVSWLEEGVGPTHPERVSVAEKRPNYSD